MPATAEGLLVLIFFIAPGAVAALVKNRLLPFSTPSPFREAVESVILSAFHAPVWILFSPIIAEVRPRITAFLKGSGSLPASDAALGFLVVLVVFFGTAPLAGALYAFFLSSNVYPRLFSKLAEPAGIFMKTGGEPEVWDSLFVRKEQWWVTIRFKDGTGYYGLCGEVSASPSDRQIYLVPASFPTATPSLYRFGPQGQLVEDLSLLPGTEKGVWIRITDQVSAIEISR